MVTSAQLYAAIAAVCPIEGVSIGDDADKTTWRIDFANEATDAQRAAAKEALAAFDISAPIPVTVPGLDFLKRLTMTEYINITNAAASALAAGDGQLALWIDMLRVHGEVDIGSPDAQNAKSMLVTSGLLTQQRADQVFI